MLHAGNILQSYGFNGFIYVINMSGIWYTGPSDNILWKKYIQIYFFHNLKRFIENFKFNTIIVLQSVQIEAAT